MTGRRLVVIRHAQAEPGGDDLERALTHRGCADARAVGEWLGARAVPQLALVSPSLRTRQTWRQAAEQMADEPVLAVDDRIYDNTVDALVDAVRGCDLAVTTLALVGHSPSVPALAVSATRETDTGMEPLLTFPTATVALLEVDEPWAAFDPARARLVAVQTCRDASNR